MAAFRCKIVRDLHWVGFTSLMNEYSHCAWKFEGGYDDDAMIVRRLSRRRLGLQEYNVSDEAGRSVYELESKKALAWLWELDASDGMHVFEWMATRHVASKKLVVGVYFAILLEYWARFAPCERSESVHSGLQVRDVKSKVTLGALKLLLVGDDDDNKVRHFESSIKFFCYDPGRHDNSDESPPLDSFVGPDLAESLGTRQVLTVRKLGLASLVDVWFEEQFPRKTVQGALLLAGYYFVPVNQYSKGTLGGCVSNLLPAVNANAPAGWWSTDPSEAFRVLNGKSQDGKDEVRWAIVGKLHWMSRITLTVSADGSFVVPRDDALFLPEIQTVGEKELVKQIGTHYASPDKRPILAVRFCGMRESSRGFFLMSSWNEKALPPVKGQENSIARAARLADENGPNLEHREEHHRANYAIFTRSGQRVGALPIGSEDLDGNSDDATWDEAPLFEILRPDTFLSLDSLENETLLDEACRAFVVRARRQRSRDDFYVMCSELEQVVRAAHCADEVGCSRNFVLVAAHASFRKRLHRVFYSHTKARKRGVWKRVWKGALNALAEVCLSCSEILISCIDWDAVSSCEPEIYSTIACKFVGSALRNSVDVFAKIHPSLPPMVLFFIEEKTAKALINRKRRESKEKGHLPCKDPIHFDDSMVPCIKEYFKSRYTPHYCIGDDGFVKLAHMRICTVDDVSSARNARAELSDSIADSAIAVGFDAEWSEAYDGCAIVQIAARDTVYIFDTMKSSDARETVAWIFLEKTFIIFGYSLTNDWKRLDFLAEGIRGKAKSIVDLQPAFGKKKRCVGLSYVAEALLGAPLCKDLQCSAWGNRPLTPAQVRYASLDASILIDIANIMVEKGMLYS